MAGYSTRNVILIRIDYKPLSINAAYTGERYKTEAYKHYKKAVTLMLKKHPLPAPPFKITLICGQSNMGADFDNPVKPFCDVLAKKFGFNDKIIYSGYIEKVEVEKGKEFIMYKLEHHEPIKISDI